MDVFAVAERAVSEHGALQKPGEFAALLALAASIEPTVIVEIGCWKGGTLWAWEQLAYKVIGIDRQFVVGPGGVTMLVGDSHGARTAVRLERLLDGRPIDLLFVDADHSYEGVSADVQTYGPLVRPGGLIALHDVLPQQGSEVARYWQQLQGIEIRCPPYTWGGIGVFRR